MVSKELKKLSRRELVEIIYQMKKTNSCCKMRLPLYRKRFRIDVSIFLQLDPLQKLPFQSRMCFLPPRQQLIFTYRKSAV